MDYIFDYKSIIDSEFKQFQIICTFIENFILKFNQILFKINLANTLKWQGK